jgi:N-acetylglucosaminyldiphosphoundecaprenol N-acetyl-beta-D-mannosaminyltransferase
VNYYNKQQTKMDICEIWGFKLITNSLDIVPFDKKILVNTMSPNSYGLATKDPAAEKALKNSDYLVLDGLYFGFAPFFLKGVRIKRIAGWDCFQYFSKKANEKNGKVFFLGSSNDTLEKMKSRFAKEFPNTKTDSYSPPYKATFSDEDNKIMHERINAFAPDVVFVGMTAPKQEKWGYENKEFISTHIISTIGNVFDWYAGNSARPGVFWQKIGLEWLIRILYRPQVFRRNISNQMIFFWHLLLVIIKIKKI